MSDPVEAKQDIWEQAPDTLRVQIRRPTLIPEAEDSLEFHAARLLLLLYYAGGESKTKSKRIEGRTKLAKMDFLVRYPTYLAEAARILGQQGNVKTNINIPATIRPESRMIRYKYGPWDERYYDIFAFLVAKDFVEIVPSAKHGDIFQLTDKGVAGVEELDGPEFDEIIERCKLVYKLFGRAAGSTIKKFIYRYFTKILDQPLGTKIEGDNA